MADQSNAEGVDLGNISLKDLFTQIDSMLGYNRDKYGKPEMKIQQDMKMTRTDKIEEIKSSMSKQCKDIDIMKAEIVLLKGQVKKKRDRNTRLEQYTRQENIRLLNVKETEEENTEALFKKVLSEMGVNVDGLRFRTVHRVSPVREARQSFTTEKRPTPRHIVARFFGCQDRNVVWESRDRVKKMENFKEAFCVPDLCKEYAEEGYVLR